jgi:serine protease Do
MPLLNLKQTKRATWAVMQPHPVPDRKGFPTPCGTGFFISEDGYFITARHVLFRNDNPDSEEFGDLGQLSLEKPDIFAPYMKYITFVKDWAKYDLALLKVDFGKNKAESLTFDEYDLTKNYLKNKESFDCLPIGYSTITEGSDVYSFGYILPRD